MSNSSFETEPHLPCGHSSPHRCRRQGSSPSLCHRHRNRCTGWWYSKRRGSGGCWAWTLPPWGSRPPAPSWLPPPGTEWGESQGVKIKWGTSGVLGIFYGLSPGCVYSVPKCHASNSVQHRNKQRLAAEQKENIYLQERILQNDIMYTLQRFSIWPRQEAQEHFL